MSADPLDRFRTTLVRPGPLGPKVGRHRCLLPIGSDPADYDELCVWTDEDLRRWTIPDMGHEATVGWPRGRQGTDRWGRVRTIGMHEEWVADIEALRRSWDGVAHRRWLRRHKHRSATLRWCQRLDEGDE